MNVSPRSSSVIVGSGSTSAGLPKEEGHDWKSYLIETHSEAALESYFKQASIPPTNDFIRGEKLESIDPRNQDSWCIGTVIETDGPRLRIRLDGTDDRNDFWRLVDSPEIRCYGTTAKSGGQLVPPLGFQQNATRWAKYFERYVKSGPFAAESSFKPPPEKPEKNFFKKGQKLEAVDPKHPHLICPATVNSVTPGDYRITLSLDGWSSSNNFKVEYTSRDIFPVGWCKRAGIRIANIGGTLTPRRLNKILTKMPNKTNANVEEKQSKDQNIGVSLALHDTTCSSTTMDVPCLNSIPDRHIKHSRDVKEDNQSSPVLNVTNETKKREPQIVTAYFNYLGDNSGMLLNPQRFRLYMPSVFGPDEYDVVLSSILDSCIRCAFTQAHLLERIRDLFPTPTDEEKNFYTRIKLENGTTIYVLLLKTKDDFWKTVHTFQDVILSGGDLFVSAKPMPLNHSDNNGYSQQLSTSLLENNRKRKSTEFLCNSDNQTLLSNNKTTRSNYYERSVHDRRLCANGSLNKVNQSKSGSKFDVNDLDALSRPETFTPSEVATFIRTIDSSFDSLASRFLQEEIDGKALLLLTTDTLMRHMGLKLGPSLKIMHCIEQLKTC